MIPDLLAEAEAAADRLLPRFGVPVARRVADAAGGEVHYLEAGDGPAVVLLHGGFGGAGNWYRTLGPLSRRFRVLAPDRPGYGLTTAQAADSVDWLADFLAALGVRRAALVGHASGAAVALAHAQLQPAAVTALAVSDAPLADAAPPGPPNPGGEAAETAPTAAHLISAGAAQAGLPPGLGGWGGGSLRGGRSRPRRVETWYTSLAARFDDRRLLAPEYLYYLWCLALLRPEQDQRPPGETAPGPAGIPGPGERTWPALPSLLVWGRGNRWAGVPLARQLHQRIPDAGLRVIEHSKGIPNLEQPGEFNYALINFLAAALRDEPR